MPDAGVKFMTMNYGPCADGEEPARFSFECPRGKGRCAGLLIERAGFPASAPSWTWNGNRTYPTFSPSIHCLSEYNGQPVSGCGWHGFIENGNVRDA